MKARISLRAIAALPKNSIIWDTEIHGLNVRRQFSDVVTYSIVYRTLDGVQRWQRIGRHGVWTPDLARKQARSVLMARDLGKDPSADRMAIRSAPTVDELCDLYIADMDAGRINGKKASTVKSDKSRIPYVHIAPGREPKRPYVQRKNDPWTPYAKPKFCCEYVRDCGLADTNEWYANNLMLPLLGEVRAGTITLKQGEELFLEAVSGGERYGPPGRGHRYFSATVAVSYPRQQEWSENFGQSDL